ncbi:MAG: MarR family transcriptional regulator [Acidobacteria bacterium]|nr:MarR family transcriptional regulator [Acidobacteriota bacterium]
MNIVNRELMERIHQRESMKRNHPGIPDIDLDMALRFIQAIHHFHRVPILMEQYFQKMGLSKARFLVLIQLFIRDEGSGIGISEICQMYDVSSPTLTGVADTLEKEGLIRRQHSEQDRRKVNLQLTEEGWSFMRRFLPAHFSNVKKIMEQYSTEEQRMLARLLDKLSAKLTELVKDEGLTVPEKPGEKA